MQNYTVTLIENKEHAGIELSFSAKPPKEVIDAVKQNGFRWHNQKKVWFARDNAARRLFAATLAGEKASEPAEKGLLEDKPLPVQKKQEQMEKNTFASCYDAIGNAKILEDANVDLYDCVEAYFSNENFFYRRTYSGDSIIVQDLTNAGRNGKACDTWTLYPTSFGEHVGIALHNECGISTCQQLFSALREGKELSGVRISHREEKGVEVFSPFTETKPLTSIPNRWNKRNFSNALLSGQIYRGVIDQHLTDDYALDASRGFDKGCELSMPAQAAEVVNDWSGLNSVCTAHQENDRSCTISFYEGSNMKKTLWLDLDCDIREGKRRAQERQAGIDSYNQMLEASCIHVDVNAIDPGKCYTIVSLDKMTNTGIYDTKTEVKQGYALQKQYEEGYDLRDTLNLSEFSVDPTLFYTVANFFHRREYAEDDKRLINCGNYQQIVSGKALLEMTKEGIYFPVIQPAESEYYQDYETARETLQAQANGKRRFMCSKQENYHESLSRLEAEHKRSHQRDLASLLSDAVRKQGAKLTEPVMRSADMREER